MSDYTFKKCPKCGQQLRLPKHIGGILMACPSCGHKFGSDFKLVSTRKLVPRGIVLTVFEMPSKILARLYRLFVSK